MNRWIGIDFGATNLRAALVDLETGQLGEVQRAGTPALEGPRAVMDAITALVEHTISRAGVERTAIAAIGIGCPAALDLSAGNLLNAPNIPGNWPEIPFKKTLETRLAIPVFPINDVRAITLGEFTFGAGRGAQTIACFAIGTGTGGGVVTNGRLHLGLSGSAGEFGHLIVDPGGLPCNCGSRGCLETIASGTAIAAQAAQAVVMRKPTLIAELAGGDLNKITSATVIEAARLADPVAQAILEKVGVYVGLAIANILVTIAPNRVLIGGGVSVAGDLLLEPIRRTVREHTYMVPIDQVEIVLTSLGDRAGLYGAALWAKESLKF